MTHKSKAYYIAIVAALLGLLLSSCQYNSTTPPKVKEQTPLWPRTMTIRELKKLYKSGATLIIPNAIIVGQVISDDSEGNIYKSIYLQDETGGIEFKAGLVNSHLLYKRGANMAIRCHALTLGKYGGLVTLGAASTDAKYENAYLPEKVTPQITQASTHRELLDIRTLTIPILQEEYANTLVKLEGVQFIDSELGQTYADATNKESVPAVERTIEDKDGNTVVLRTSSHALFADRSLPEGSGNIVAILSFFNGKPQLIVSLESDINFNAPRFAAKSK